ncbi:transcription repressor OFP15-like [Salvia divinorum]|uniref:Transcription repressor n=1 Tax=Salvia divinorum TaxID=28513 RepID=A0ABD1GYN1_SALDI
MGNKKKFPFASSPWPCVNNPKTLSFRANGDSFSFPDESAVIGALRSDRLFFDPGETSSILEEAHHAFPYNDGVKIIAIDSNDPFLDFRSSMAEMVEAHGLNSWDCLEELLTCYLRLNDKANHGYIVGAYVDLLINQASSSEHCSSSTRYSFTSPLSFSSSTTYSQDQIAAG